MIQKIKLNAYDNMMIDFFRLINGCFVVLSQNSSFVKVLSVALKSIDLNSIKIYNSHNFEKFNINKDDLFYQHDFILFFIDYETDGYDNIYEIKKIKADFGGDNKIIALTTTIQKNKIIQMYEMGADNVIVKPISVNSLIQKIALTTTSNKKISDNVKNIKKLIGDGNFKRAHEVIDNILKDKSDSVVALMLKGDMAIKQNNFIEAEFFFKKAEAQSKLCFEPLKKLVKLYESIGEHEKKLKYLKKLEKISPLNFDRKIEIGETYIALDNENMAFENFDQSIKMVRKQNKSMISSVCMKIAKSIGDSKPDLKAIYIEQAIRAKGRKLAQEDVWMFNERGVCLRQNGDWEDAVVCYMDALKIAPLDGGLYYNLAMAFAQGKKYNKALINFKKALEVQPDIISRSANIGYNIAGVCLSLNKDQEAIRYLQKSIKIDPEFEKANKLLQKILKKKNEKILRQSDIR